MCRARVRVCVCVWIHILAVDSAKLRGGSFLLGHVSLGNHLVISKRVSRFGVWEERGCWVLLWNASNKPSEKPKETKSNPIYEAPNIIVNPIESAVKWWNHSSESKIRLRFIRLGDISHTLDTADRHCEGNSDSTSCQNTEVPSLHTAEPIHYHKTYNEVQKSECTHENLSLI